MIITPAPPPPTPPTPPLDNSSYYGEMGPIYHGRLGPFTAQSCSHSLPALLLSCAGLLLLPKSLAFMAQLWRFCGASEEYPGRICDASMSHLCGICEASLSQL